MLVHRRAYVRSDGTVVRAATFTIKDRGRPGRGPKLFTLKKGGLGQYGYPEGGRKALDRAVSSESALTIFRRLQALGTLMKRTSPAKSAKFLRNRNWVRSKYMGGCGCK